MSKKRNIVNEFLERNCLITPDCYEILEDLDDDILDVDRLAEMLKNEIVITADKLKEALVSFENVLSEGEIQDLQSIHEPRELEKDAPTEFGKEITQAKNGCQSFFSGGKP